MRIVITGASGYIGSGLSSCLEKYPQVSEVIELSRSDKIWCGSPYSLAGWDKIINNVDVIYHLGGNTDIHWAECNQDQSLSQSIDPIINLIKSSQKASKKIRVIYASTVSVYGLIYQTEINENFLPYPYTIYDLHKLFAENYLNLASTNENFTAISLRFSNVYGPSKVNIKNESRGVLNRMILSAVQGKNLELYGGYELIRDYIYIDDLIEALCKCASEDNFKSGVYNLCYGVSYSLEDALNIVRKSVKEKCGVNIEIKKIEPSKEINRINFRNFRGDNSKFSTNFNWSPKINLRAGINMSIDYAFNNLNLI